MPKQAATAPRTATKDSAKPPAKKRARTVSAPPVALRQPSHADIAERAYALYAARGFRDGDPVVDWLDAERQLRA